MTSEVNFDGLVGPTHNYAGLSQGNLASMSHKGAISNPRDAALQGLAKMRRLHELGLRQAFLPPLERPSIPTLRRFGFGGTPAEALAGAKAHAPQLLVTACSASAMWTANAATVAPRNDTSDHRTHLTPANLIANVHRSLEAPETSANLLRIFPAGPLFAHSAAVPGTLQLGDEGAANHTRLCPQHEDSGLHLFVYGAAAPDREEQRPKRYVARQSLEASMAVARLNQVPQERCVFIRQNPAAIEAGVFHNDVIATGNENVLLYHEEAYVDTPAAIGELSETYRRLFDRELAAVCVPTSRVSLAEAVRSYLFNSQIISLPGKVMLLLAPEECAENGPVRGMVEEIIADPANPIEAVEYLDLRASMQNGGGPACLRLRVVLDDDSWAAVADGVKVDTEKLEKLEAWIRRHYRDELSASDLADPQFLDECYSALDELTTLIELPELYHFQR